MAFTKQLMDAIAAEASAMGLRNATEITVALREALVDARKGGDGRVKAYWVAGQVVNQGTAYPLPGAVQVQGLDSLSALAVNAELFVFQTPLATLAPDCAKSKIGAARVSLTRKGEAHVQVLLPHSKQPPNTPDAWVDLYVFKTEGAARAAAEGLKPGRVF